MPSPSIPTRMFLPGRRTPAVTSAPRLAEARQLWDHRWSGPSVQTVALPSPTSLSGEVVRVHACAAEPSHERCTEAIEPSSVSRTTLIGRYRYFDGLVGVHPLSNRSSV